MAAQPSTPTFCLTIPSGRWNLAALVDAIRIHHPESPVTAVWCGDPHLRPALDASLGVRWADIGLPEPQGVAWGLLLAGLPTRSYEWCRTAASVDRLLGDGSESVISLRVGSTAVLGNCSSLVANDASVVLVPRTQGELPADGVAPGEDDLIATGEHSTAIAGFGLGGRAALAWLIERLPRASAPIESWIDRMAERPEVARNIDPSVHVAGWHAVSDDSIAVIDLDHLDHDEPWHFTFDRPARIRLSTEPRLAAVITAAMRQCVGEPAPVLLPGGVEIDPAMNAVVGAAIRDSSGNGDLPPEPFGPVGSGFTRWLEGSEPWAAELGRYWLQLRTNRADLLTIFPNPQSTDATRFREWIDTSWRLEPGRSVLLRSSAASFQPIASTGFDPCGINVLGYFDFDQSQGHIARRLAEALTSAGVPVTPLNHHRTQGSRRPVPISAPRAANYATNLVVVNADQFEFVVADHGDSLLAGRRTIAYWFWELEHVPERFRDAIDHVDEIWTGSQFIADAFARVTDKPVRCVPLPVSEPHPSSLDRASMGLPADAYVFLTTFDQFSVPERKNPFGTIDAFTRAFADGEGPVLLIKTMNGAKGWRNHERLLLAASGRRDIIVWDEHLSRADQMAVLAAADCLVSLHRSEGLGLHCAEAMWLGKPVIATAYSGNLDFMDDTVAAMIDHQLVHVRHGEGIYPEDALWADPDLDQAAAWMRRLASDPALGQAIGAQARARMQRQPSLAETGRMMAALAGLQPSTSTETTSTISGGTSSWD